MFLNFLLSILGTFVLWKESVACTNTGSPTYHTTKPNPDELPVILWWKDNLFPHEGEDDMYEFVCPGSRSICAATKNREVLKTDKDVSVMIYGSDFEINDAPLPRKSTHMWALLHEESPQNNYMLQHAEVLSLFNFTATFKRQSDYPLSTQYVPSFAYLTEREPVTIEVKNKLRKNGMASVMYLQSNCDVPSDRDRYVKELMEHIDIDSYGKCLNNIHFQNHRLSEGVASMEDKELLKIMANYKFHLAFENAICDDYVTEKFYRSFHVGSVPVYYGSPNIREWAPDTHSVIVVEDYASPERLARFLNYLDSNDDAYNKYLAYRQTGITNQLLKDDLENRNYGVGKSIPHFVPGFECYVCDQMTAIKKDQKEDIPIHEKSAPGEHLTCPLPKPSLGKKEDISGHDNFHSWPKQFIQSIFSALALQDMIKAGETDSSQADKYIERRMNMNKHTDL